MRHEELFELEPLVLEELRDDPLVACREVHYADLAAVARYVVDYLARDRLAQCEVVSRGIAFLHDLHERLDGEGVVLAGDGELRFPHRLARVLLLDPRGVVENLPRRGEELLALPRDGDAARRPREDGGAELLFERANRLGERRLRDEDAPRGFADAAVRRHCVCILELLECHADIIPFLRLGRGVELRMPGEGGYVAPAD